MQSNIGLYKKYNITKADGSPVDPSAQYFILCPTTDLHARTALRAYADAVRYENPTLAFDITEMLDDMELIDEVESPEDHAEE